MTNDNPLAALNDASLLRTQALVNGEWVSGNASFAVTDPATGQHLAAVPNLGRADAEAAITAAITLWLLGVARPPKSVAQF